MAEVVEEVKSGELKEAPLPSPSAFARGLVVWVVLGAVLPSVLGLLGRWGWLLDLCNHFRFQCMVALMGAAVALLLLRAWRWALVSLAGLGLNLCFVLPLYLGSPVPAAPDSPGLTVMHFNVNTGNTHHAGVIEEVLAHGPDLLFVQEVNNRWLDALKQGLAGYDLVVEDARADNFGIACFVREPGDGATAIAVTSARAFDPTQGVAQVPAIKVGLTVEGRALNVLSIHPLPPISAPYAKARDATLQAAGVWAAGQDVPCIVVGDFNATPWSTAFRDLQAAGGLVNSQVGFGRSPTWPAGLNELGMIPIDHLLHSDGLTTLGRHVGEARGSDHRPLIVDIGWYR